MDSKGFLMDSERFSNRFGSLGCQGHRIDL
jgi:hypothetical protein